MKIGRFEFKIHPKMTDAELFQTAVGIRLEKFDKKIEGIRQILMEEINKRDNEIWNLVKRIEKLESSAKLTSEVLEKITNGN